MPVVDLNPFFTQPNGFRQALALAGLARRTPENLIGKLFRFEVETPNEDDANPRETDRHVIIGTILGVHLDESIHEIVLAIPNTRIGLDEITKLAYSFLSERWHIEVYDGEVYEDYPGVLTIIS